MRPPDDLWLVIAFGGFGGLGLGLGVVLGVAIARWLRRYLDRDDREDRSHAGPRD